MNKHFIVIGAGLVGVSTAIWLQRAGQKVTIIDKIGPATGASYGNAGVLATGSIIPVTTPGLLKKAPKMLLNVNEPLFLKWAYLPKLLPFLLKYLKHANKKSVTRIASGLNTLLKDTPEQHFALAEGTPAEKYLTAGDYLFAYDSQKDFEADAFAWEIRNKYEVSYEQLDSESTAEYDPALKDRFGCVIRFGHHGKISDPGAYLTTLFDHFIAEGGEYQQNELMDFEIQNSHCSSINTSSGKMTADEYILTTGAWSSQWQKQLGVTIPLESERGYHVEFVNPSITLKSPVMVASGKFVLHSMDGRLRCAGIVEFGGLNAPKSEAPIQLLINQIKKLFPDLTYDSVKEWLGHRPATSDSLPIIGTSPKADNVKVGYGHHHIGLSGGPKTGRWLASLATNESIDEDLSIYKPDRRV